MRKAEESQSNTVALHAIIHELEMKQYENAGSNN